MTGARVVLILAALSPFCFAAIVLIGAVRRLRSRGEEAGTPDLTCGCPADGRPVYSCLYCDNSRCAAHRDQHEHAAELDHFAVWEAECSKLQRLADKLGTR